ncbi:MAG TPA: AsmA-like C-terminal region-containing protein [Bryobacteraceae bacterium]|jgi:hypothetical protein|nr:AsmA-like C-terminal region-containing protein [Bryobacteraceae bacterium]
MRKWLLGASCAVALLLGGLAAAGWIAARRFEPFVRQQAIAYLQDRFGTGVAVRELHVSVAFLSPWHPRSARLRLWGEGLKIGSLVTVGQFRMDTELGALWEQPRRIRDVRLEALELNIRPRLASAEVEKGAGTPAPEAVVVQRMEARSALVRIFPADAAKLPREDEVQHVVLTGAQPGKGFQYEAELRNPKPPGTVQVAGSFGPWRRDDPGETPISGAYTFTGADLGAFRTIAGILDSTGRFEGPLRRIAVHGETRTPQFRLAGGNALPLTTRFDSIVDGTSGDTFLQPVRARLGSTDIVARGRIVRPPGPKARSIVLDVAVDKGRIEDLVRLAVKASQPFLQGSIDLRTKMQILPVAGRDMRQRLLLDGNFSMDESQFSGGSVQQKIDMLSRRAQGQPKNQEIADVFSSLRGGFAMEDGELRFSDLVFQVPGAAIHLHGTYGIYSEQIDLHGVARLQAKASQTMSGWKRLALKPIDPLLSRAGAGTLLPIQITGTRAEPHFGLDRGRKGQANAADRAPR